MVLVHAIALIFVRMYTRAILKMCTYSKSPLVLLLKAFTESQERSRDPSDKSENALSFQIQVHLPLHLPLHRNFIAIDYPFLPFEPTRAG